MANTRNLKSGEKKILSQVFVKTLPLDRIIITDKLGLGDRPYTMPMLLNKNYHINVGDHYNIDMSTNQTINRYKSNDLLVHECVHVWQGVHGIFEWDYIINSVACQIGGSAYDYTPGKDWMWYGAEKQAQIVEDWYKEGMLVTNNKWRYIRDDLRKHGFGGQAYFFKASEYLRWTIGEGADDGYPKEISSAWNSFVQGSRAGFSRIVEEHEYYYFFKGDEYIKWKIGSGTADGYPKKISDEWESSFIANGIDAALNFDNNQVYFFKGNQYIRYTFGKGQDAGYPKKISDSFDSSFIKDGFDTCIYWGNGKAYFFKGDQYIRYTIGQGADSGYPKKIGDTWHSFMRNGLKIGLLKRKDVF
jgi:matrix metalloproteinase-14 (membrane-inserted)